MSTKPLPMLELRDQIAKAIADSVGHGMREKCEKQADAVLTVVMPQLSATAEHTIAHLSAQAKVRVTDEDVDRACDVYDDHYSAEVLGSGCIASDNHSQALRAALESFAARLSQGAQCKGCNGVGEIGGLTPQGYDGEVCPFCAGTGEDVSQGAQGEADVDRMCQAFYENKGSMKWEKLMECWKDNYRSNMRAAIEACAAPQPLEGARVVPDGMTLVPNRFVELVRAAQRATHPRAAPQLIADAIEELAAPTLAGKEGS